MRYESANVQESVGLDPAALSPANPREKWLRKRTQVKLRVCAGWSHPLAVSGPGEVGLPLGLEHLHGAEALGLPLRAECHVCWASCFREPVALQQGWGEGYT